MNKKHRIQAAVALVIGTTLLVPVAAFAQAQTMVRLMDATARSGLRGYTRIANVRPRTGMLEPGGQIELSFRLRKGQKYGFVGVGDDNANDVDLSIVDANGDVIDVDEEEDATAWLAYTAESDGIYDVVVKMYDCQDTECGYALGAYKK